MEEEKSLQSEDEEENSGDAGIGWEGLNPQAAKGQEAGEDLLEDGEDLEEYGIPSEETKQQQRQTKQVFKQCDELWHRAERLKLPQNHPIIRDIYANLSQLQTDRATKKLIKLESARAKEFEDKLRGKIRQEVMGEYNIEDKEAGRLPPDSGGDRTKAQERLREIEKRYCQSQASDEEYQKARRDAGVDY